VPAIEADKSGAGHTEAAIFTASHARSPTPTVPDTHPGVPDQHLQICWPPAVRGFLCPEIDHFFGTVVLDRQVRDKPSLNPPEHWVASAGVVCEPVSA
jgi:hypothetical protein